MIEPIKPIIVPAARPLPPLIPPIPLFGPIPQNAGPEPVVEGQDAPAAPRVDAPGDAAPLERRKTPYVPKPRRDVAVQVPTRKRALDQSRQGRGRLKNTPPKNDANGNSNPKRRLWKKQQEQKYPERHPDSRYPNKHFHDTNKQNMKDKERTTPWVNRHLYYPKKLG